MKHTIHILPTAAVGRYRVSGACQIEDTDKPVQAAAHALKAAGAADADMLHATGPDIPTFLALTIGKVLAPRPRPPKALSALTNGRGPTNP